MKSFSFDSKFGKYLLQFIQHYNHRKYWRRRAIVIDPANKTNVLLKLYYLYYIKRTDAYHNCSFGTNLNSGPTFETPPILPHGPNGIIVGHDLKIGKNVRIYQQVTLAHGGSVVGDNVIFGAGSRLLGGSHVGHYCKIGANAVVVEDIGDYAVVVLQKPRVIYKSKEEMENDRTD